MILFSSPTSILKTSNAVDEVAGKLSSQLAEQKLMHAVLSNDQTTINEGKIIQEALNRGIGSFTPDMLFEHLVKNYAMATQLFGETLIKLLLGYNASYLQRNLRIPEFARELKQKIEQKITELKDKGLLDNDGFIAPKGIDLASIVLYVQELESLHAKGMLEPGTTLSPYGERSTARNYQRGDSYKSVALRPSISRATRRGRTTLTAHDLKVSTRVAKGKISLIYALDSSASMKGEKIDLCKKAGIALTYKALARNDQVGIVSFSARIKDSVAPTTDFSTLLHTITKISASEQTDFNHVMHETIDLFPNNKTTKHVLILTDALPTVGTQPEKTTLQAVADAHNKGITISVIGINLDDKGTKLAEAIAQTGEGRFFVVKNLEDLDRIVLEDYYAVQREIA